MPGVSLVNRATGQEELVDPSAVANAVASGKYIDPGAIAVHRDGLDTYAPTDVAGREQLFSPAIDPAQAARAGGHLIRQRENTGALATAKAFVGGAVSGASFGLANPFEDAREFNPIAGGAGVLVGAIAPAFAGDVGGLLGLGREAGLAEDALSAERATSGLSSKLLFSGEAAEGTGVEGDLIKAGTKLAEPAATAIPTSAATTARADLGELDAAGLTEARKAELEAIDAARQPERDAFVDALREHADKTQAEELWGYTSKHPDRVVRGLGKESREADIKVRNLLKNEEALSRNPEIARDALERQAQALAKIESKGLAEHAQFQRDFLRGPATIRQEILDGKMSGYVVGKGGISPNSPLIDQAVEREMVKRFGTADTNLAAGPVLPERLQTVMDSAGTARTRVTQLRRDIEELSTEPMSPRLEAIDAAKKALGEPVQQSLGEQLFHGAASLAGPVGKVAEKAWSGVRKLIAGGAKRASGAASSFVTTAKSAIPHVPVISSRVLASTAFGPARAAVAAAADAAPAAVPRAAAAAARASGTSASAAATGMVADYQRRTDEIRSQTMYDASGTPVMRPEARQALASRLAPIAAASPLLADRMESVAVRRIEYLASIIPRIPDYGTIQIGPDRRRPSELQMRSFARSMAAIEDPHAAMERLVHGTFTPEDGKALRAVYPEMVADLTQQVAQQLPTLRQTLPYSRRLALSIFTGVPVDPAMTPGVLRQIQGMYAAEPGTAGGTQAAVPQPQFGSVKRDPGTESQRRQGAIT